MKKVLERYDEIISDLANHDAFLTRLDDEPNLQVLNIFYEDQNFKEKEISFTINLN